MKKIALFIIVVLGFTISTKAQSATRMPLAVGDTIITSSSTDSVFKYLPVTAGYSVMTIQVVTQKLSGTITGRAYLEGTLDGTNYTLTDSSSTFADQTTNSVFFNKTPPVYTKYRISVHQPSSAASTQSNIVRVWYVLKKYNNQ